MKVTMKNNVVSLAIVSAALIGINEVESVESKLRGANVTPMKAKSIHDNSGTSNQKAHTGKRKSFTLSGDWMINTGWSNENDEDDITNEKADTEERNSTNIEFTGDWMMKTWSKNNNREDANNKKEANEQIERKAASNSVVENKNENFPIRWKNSNGEEIKTRKSRADSSSDSEIKWTRSTHIKNKFQSPKIYDDDEFLSSSTEDYDVDDIDDEDGDNDNGKTVKMISMLKNYRALYYPHFDEFLEVSS